MGWRQTSKTTNFPIAGPFYPTVAGSLFPRIPFCRSHIVEKLLLLLLLYYSAARRFRTQPPKLLELVFVALNSRKYASSSGRLPSCQLCQLCQLLLLLLLPRFEPAASLSSAHSRALLNTSACSVQLLHKPFFIKLVHRVET